MKRLKIVAAVTFIFALLTIIFWPTIVATFGLLTAQYITRDGLVETVPIERILAETRFTGQVFSFRDITFELPGEFSNSTTTEESIQVVHGEKVFFLGVDSGVKDEFFSESTHEEQALMMSDPLWSDALASNYNLFSAIMYTLPEDASMWSNKEQKLFTSILLLLKSTIVTEGKVHHFTTPQIRGFETVTQAEPLTTVTVFFTNKDQQFTIAARGFSREETDFILNSVQLSDS